MGFLEKALSALPSVAGSPLAFAAYLAAIVAWVVIAWRVNRNKQLLRNLDKLPERSRLEALRMEMGAVRLKSGLSPEQWIRSRIHLYYFMGFAILALVGTALFTVSAVTAEDPGTVGSDVTLFQENGGAGSAPAAPRGTGDIRLASLQVDNAYDGSGSQGIEFDLGNYPPEVTLTYSYDRTGQEIRIRPEMPYLSRLLAGGPIATLEYSDSPFRWQFPKLSVKVVNNTKRTLLLSEAIVEVKRSAIDREPVLVIPYSYDLVFVNEGWGNVIDPRVEFGIAEKAACATPAIDDALRPNAVSLDSFNQASAAIPIRVGGYVPATFQGQEDVCVYGVIAFTADDRERRSLKFRARVPIGEGGFGAAEEPSYFYDLFLKAGVTGQSQHVPVSQTIKPGEADHFVFRIAADKSARFDLGLSLRDAGGAIIPLQDVHLDLFVPRSQAGYVVQRPRQ